MARIFISHSPADEPFARQLANALDDYGAELWLGTTVLPNPRWHNDLPEGFQTGDAMIVILSKIAVEERKVVGDWNAYYEQRKPVVLVAAEAPEVFGMALERNQYVDFYSQPYPDSVRQLVETLRYHNALPPAPAAPPPVVLTPAQGIPQTAQPAAQPRRVTLPSIGGLRRGERTQQVTLQETDVIPVEREQRRLPIVPIAVGVVLALIACAALILLVVLPQNQRANEEATAFANQTSVALANLTQAAQAQIDQATFAASQATSEALQGTQIALNATDQASNGAASAASATAAAGTAAAQEVILAITQTAEVFVGDVATLAALQGTLSAQQAANLGLPPATPPTSNRFAEQSLIFNIQSEQFIGQYAVREWADPTFTFEVLTIDHATQPRIQVDSYRGGSLMDITGTDITGEGNPDVVYEMSYGGATGLACSVYVFNLGPTVTRLVETPTGACGARVADLNSDGREELIIADTTFAYQFCSGAESPLIEAVLAYDPVGRTFRPQSANFPAYYRAQAEAFLARTDLPTQLTAQAEAGNMESVKCGVLGVVLPYLYGGMTNEAWTNFRTLYPYSDAAAFRAQIEQLFTSSPFCK
jgi:type II secretory pathway pseudopilin PulG